MKALVVYDSAYGNTAKIAVAMAAAVPGAAAREFRELKPVDLDVLELLIVGCPTQGGRPTTNLHDWLKALPAEKVSGVKVAVFDTRIDAAGQKLPLRLLMSLIGYAAPKLAKILSVKGAIIIANPEGFFVERREGPLRTGEVERAGRWAGQLARLRPAGNEAVASGPP